MSRLIDLALRTMPRAERRENGAAIESVAAELIEAGDSSTLKEALGIAGHGVRKHIRLNVDWLRALPWREALWLLALPIASAQTLILALSEPSVDPWLIPTTLLLVVAFAVGPPARRVSWRASRRADRGLAAGILLASQTPLIGLQLAYSAVDVGVTRPFPVGAALPLLLAILLLPLVAACAIVRTTAGPGRTG